MRPAFTKALYYPSIDIKNSDWLKTAVLFWDSISTIVPETIDNPYEKFETKYLADIGFLEPIYVNSDHNSVKDIENDIIELINIPEFYNMLSISKNKNLKVFNNKKIVYDIKNRLEEHFYEELHSKKISNNVKHNLKKIIDESLYQDGLYFLDREFTHIYMLTLANKISENQSIALVTDEIPASRFSNSIRTGNLNQDKHQLKQGLFLDLIVKGLQISPDSELPDIIEFKEKHKDELGLFRTQLAELTKGVSSNKSFSEMQKEIKDSYETNFLPAYNNFTKALKSSRIKWLTDSLLKTSSFSISSTSVPMIALGSEIPQALLAGMGISLIASTIFYNVNKEQYLRENPYSYLLYTKKELI